MFDVLWNNKPEKIKRKLITKQYDKRGLKMLDVDKFLISLKSSWIKRLLD